MFVTNPRATSYQKAYGYKYDAVGRMTGADFTEAGGSVWSNASQDYSVSNLTYDANSNMLSMIQKGVPPGTAAGTTIDDPTYTHAANSNQLQKVEDAITTTYGLHDFQNGNIGSTDYAYDNNGNLLSDANKDITGITYNFLDLPTQVSKGDGSTIDNIYDAAGALLQKTITTSAGMTTYRYWGPFVYRNAELEHFYHAEGKARWIAQDSKFEYDYFVKDHLGNVRSVVTPEIAAPLIYIATHEMPAATVAEEIFENIDDVRGERPGGGSPSDIAAAILNGGNDSTRIGTALLLRTMAGDKVKLKVSAFFASAGDSTMNVQASSSQMLSALLGTLGGAGSVGGSGEGGGSTGLPGNLLTEGNYTGIYDAIKESVTNSAFPRAYLNWIGFDGNMRLVASQSGAIQVDAGSTDAWESLEPGELTMAKSGYLVVYLSNEAYMDVAFDQLSVTHYRGKLLQEQHYYPHGLVIDGVTAPGAQPTREKYQGKELQDELGLELYDFHARQYDPQLGRFWGIDPMDQFPGGYTGMGNDPANMVDPDGMQAGVSNNAIEPADATYNSAGTDAAYDSGNQLDDYLNSTPGVGGGDDPQVDGDKGGQGQSSTWTRLNGLAQGVGGLLEMIGGAIGGAATSWTGIGGVLGGIAVVDGADNAATGFTKLFSGEEQETVIHQGVSKTLKSAGVSPAKAEESATIFTTAIPFMIGVPRQISGPLKFVPTAPIAPRVIKSMSPHAVDRAIERGFKPTDIMRIVKLGTPVLVQGKYASQWKYMLKGNTVVVDATRCRVITMFSNNPGLGRYNLGRGFINP